MSKLPIIDARTMEKAILHLGFAMVRKRGSHAFYRHSDGRTTTIPHHGHRDLARPLIRAILRDIELSPDEYCELLDQM